MLGTQCRKMPAPDVEPHGAKHNLAESQQDEQGARETGLDGRSSAARALAATVALHIAINNTGYFFNAGMPEDRRKLLILYFMSVYTRC